MEIRHDEYNMINDNIPEAPVNQTIIGLAGNPNTGKSTLFNYLTGLKQHTGNWPGKTVANAKGNFIYNDINYLLVDLPGTYSLFIDSEEEEIARNFICFNKPRITIIVVDGTNLERNLNLVLQVMEATDNAIVCINLMDEAKRKGIHIDTKKLETLLGVPVIPIVARDGVGIENLLKVVDDIHSGYLNILPNRVSYGKDIEGSIAKIEDILAEHIHEDYNLRWIALRLMDGDSSIKSRLQSELKDKDLYKPLVEIEKIIQGQDSIADKIVTILYRKAETISQKVITMDKNNDDDWDNKLDNILTSKFIGYPIMLLLLGFIFWITIVGSNYPSDALSRLFSAIEPRLSNCLLMINPPTWLHGLLIFGIYRTVAWVISVMLPPMAIFFPLFTLLEDLGYLPRIAFNLDNFFKKAGSQGKQALTMSMGFGCNAAGIISARIISSPREKLIAIITNNFVPCNGRFPIIITISTIFMGRFLNQRYSSIIAAFYVLLMVVIGIMVTLLTSKLLSITILRGVPSSFTLELPPYRRPQIGKVIIRSIFDRTLFLLAKAIVVAAPAGLITWFFSNMTFNGLSLLNISANFLDPLGQILGLDGFILMAFLLGLPANEIVLPILIMSYMSQETMLELNNIEALKNLLLDNNWNFVTALNFMLFSLLHFPCGTTLLTIKNETGGMKWPMFTFALTTSVAIVVTFMVNMVFNIIL